MQGFMICRRTKILGGMTVLSKIYLYVKKDIEAEKTFLLLAEASAFLLVWSVACILHLIMPLSAIYSRVATTSLFAANVVFVLSVIVFAAFFIISAFSVAELIHRAKVRNGLLKSKGGWILIESMTGILILSVALLALLLTFTQATKGTSASTNRTQATYLAQQALEKLKAQDGNVAIDTSVITTPKDGFNIAISVPAVTAITSDVSAKKLGDYLKPYQVTVSWTENGNANNVIMIGYCYVSP